MHAPGFAGLTVLVLCIVVLAGAAVSSAGAAKNRHHARAGLHGRADERARRGQLALQHGEPARRPLLVADAGHARQREHAERGVAHPPRHVRRRRTRTAARSRPMRSSTRAPTTSRRRRATCSRWTPRPASTLWHYTPAYPHRLQRRDGRTAARRRDRRPARSSPPGATARSSRSTRCSAARSGRPSSCPWRKGGRVSDAPIYVNGIILSGDSGGDGGSPQQQHARPRRHHRCAALDLDHDPQARPAGLGTRGRRSDHREELRLRRRRALGVADRRHEEQPRHLRHRQHRAVELARPGQEPLDRLDRRAQPLHRTARVGLPDHPSRHVGLRPAEQRRHVRRAVQGDGEVQEDDPGQVPRQGQGATGSSSR